VTPLTLGIETEGGILTPMIERNTSIPKDAKNIFSTAADGQTRVTVRVFQGESQLAEDPANRLLAEFDLDGIPPAPRGVPKIEVTFKIDHNGILNVQAKDLGTGKENKVEIKGSSGLDPKEVEKMRRDAESHAGETKKKVELINARNEAEHQVYAVEKALKDNAEKISAGDRSAVEAAVAHVKSVAKGDDTAAIKRAVEELTQASQAMAQHLYSQAGTPESGDGAAAGKGEDVQDAEFEVKS
jgi:molecular chaperone DnaK